MILIHYQYGASLVEFKVVVVDGVTDVEGDDGVNKELEVY